MTACARPMPRAEVDLAGEGQRGALGVRRADLEVGAPGLPVGVDTGTAPWPPRR